MSAVVIWTLYRLEGCPQSPCLEAIRHSFGAVQVARIDLLASRDGPPVEIKLRAVGIRVFHRIGIEILIHVRDSFGALAVMAAAQRLGLDRPLVFHPSQMIDDVDIKVVEAAAAGPDEAVEALHLVEQIGDPGRFGKRGEISAGPVHPVTPLRG